MNEFEDYLKKQPHRPLPPGWRTEILSAARAGRVEPAKPARQIAAPKGEHPWWLAWLWPSPTAWAGVACTWGVILAMDADSQPDASEQMNLAQSPSPVELLAFFSVQKRQMDALFRSESEGKPPCIFRLPEGKPGAFVRPQFETQTV